jgi:cytochrome c peroxidase
MSPQKFSLVLCLGLVPAAFPQVSTQGRWTGVITTSVNPVGAAALPDGKVLIWSAYDRYTFGSNVSAQTLTAVFDPATGQSTERMITETAHDMFCPGTSYLPDGRLLITGGDTPGRSSIYNPGTASWSAGGNLNVPRGYQGQVTVDDGRAFVLGGSWSGGSGGKNGETWRNNLWTYLPNALASVTLGPDPAGQATSDRHPWLFAIGGGRVLHAGPSRAMNLYDLNAAGGQTTAAGNRGDDVFSQNGTAVMYDIGKILKAGGAPAYDNASATAGSYIIDVTNGVTVTKTGSMRRARGMHNAVVLPNGEVMVVGGMPVPVTFSDHNAILVPEIWNPTTGAWRDVAPISVPRTYHSTALLLPDGRVFVGGGGLCGAGCGANHSDVQIYSPAYLFNSDGTDAVRPTILSAPGTAAHGATIDVSTNGGTQFVLVRYGAVTHTVNSDQRRIPLAATLLSSGFYRLTIPSAAISTPGNYMLFALNAQGVPSIARTINIQPAPQPSITLTSPTNNQSFVAPASIAIQASVNDPLRTVTRVEFYNGSALLGQSTAAPYAFTWTNVATGAYTIRATLIDNSGFTASATAAVTVISGQTVTNTSTMGTAQGQWAGTAFTLACNGGEVVAGLAGNAGTWLTRVSPLCVGVNGSGAWVGNPVARGTAGGGAGTAFTKTCPANQAVYAYDGRAGWGVDNLQVHCKAIAAGGTVTGAGTALGAVGGTGGSVVSLTACPTPVPATAIRGIAGTELGQFGLSCSTPAVSTNQPPALSLTSPANNATYNAPASVVISASASDPEGNLARVEFFQGATRLGEATAAPYTFNWNNVQAGSYTVRAVATDAAGLSASASAAITVNASAGGPPAVLQSLKGAPVPEPASLGSFVTNRTAAIALGKALFWDVQVSSDNKVACASCHFQAGADVRTHNQSNPGMNRAGLTSFSFAPTRSAAAASGPNYRMKPADFPQYELSAPGDASSTIVFSTTDLMGSQGVARRTLTSAGTAPAADVCSETADPVFGGARQSTARNAPTVINAVFNLRNFYDGRANHIFNGVDAFGKRNGQAVIYRGNPPVAQAVALENASLASQAVAVPVNSIEMSCAGRTWPQIGRRLLRSVPLAYQAVSSSDSVLASYAAAGGRGLNASYDAMVRAAFATDLWNSPTAVSIGGQSFSQAEANFALFFGLALQMYQSTLVSNDAPIDRYFASYPSTTVANASALTTTETLGLNLFTGKAGCVACHSGPQLTNAGTPAFAALASGVIADRMSQADSNPGIYDFGFYNIGVRGTSHDVGVGGTDPFGNPLSFTRQAISGVNKDIFTLTPCAFSTGACTPVSSTERATVDGAFKTPTLRNVALTGPYFHDGSLATLEDVVQFYIRRGNARATTNGDTSGFGANTSNLAGQFPRIELSGAETAALVQFLRTALTDARVSFERAPFDHPELPLVEGDSVVLVPAVGSAGRSTALRPFADLLAAGGLGYSTANLPPVVSSPGNQTTAAGTVVSLQLSAIDPEGATVTFSATGLPAGLSIDTAGRITGTPSAAAMATVTVNAADPAGNRGSVSFSWTVSGGGATRVNLAAGKAATQSSTGYSGVASRAADGNTNGVYSANSVTHTNWNAQPYWQVDLGSAAQLSEIAVWNRTDCCTTRLSNFHVLISNTPFTSVSLTTVQAQSGVTDLRFGGAAGQVSRFAVNRTGRYVRIQLEGTNYLSLAEVEVFGTPAAAPATFTSTIINVNSNQCIDIFGGRTTAGADVIQYGCHGGDNQKFQFDLVSGTAGTYTVKAVHSGLCMDISGGALTAGTKLIQNICSSTNSQRFSVTRQADGSYRMQAVHSGLTVLVPGGSTTQAAVLQQGAWTGANSQKWRVAGLP